MPPLTVPGRQRAPAKSHTLAPGSPGHRQETAVLEDFNRHLVWLQTKLESQQGLIQHVLATSSKDLGVQGRSAVEANRVVSGIELNRT